MKPPLNNKTPTEIEVEHLMGLTQAHRTQFLAEYCPEKQRAMLNALLDQWMLVLIQCCTADDRAVFLDYMQKTDADLYGKVLARMVTMETTQPRIQSLKNTITEVIAC